MNQGLVKTLMSLGMSLAGGALAAGSMLYRTEPPAVPIAILDRGSLLRTLDENLPEKERARHLERFENMARQLSEAGYLVIDRGWVIAAPEDFYVDPQ